MKTIKYRGKELSYKEASAQMHTDGASARNFDEADPNLTDFAKWLKEHDPVELIHLPSSVLTEEYMEAAVVAASEKLIFVPTRFKTERVVTAAINSAAAKGENPPPLNFIPHDKVTDKIQDAYIAAGGRYLYNISYEKMTPELIERALEADICVNIRYLPAKEQTKERWKMCLRKYPTMLDSVPPEFLTQDTCDTAMEAGTFAVYKLVPKKMRTEAMLIQSLKHLLPQDTVASVLRESPATAKTDKALAASYEEFLKELDPANPRSYHASSGKITDLAFMRYIQKQGKVTIPAPMSEPVFTLEKTVDGYTEEELRNIYTALYEMSLEAASDDYLEGYEVYAPENLDPGRDAVISGLRSLVGELLDDLGSVTEVTSWLDTCGASGPLVDFLLG